MIDDDTHEYDCAPFYALLSEPDGSRKKEVEDAAQSGDAEADDEREYDIGGEAG